LGQLSTIIGQNDAGKSHILQALKIFLEVDANIEINNIYNGIEPGERVVIEVAFTSLPDSIELDCVRSTLRDEMLIDANGYLRIRKTYTYYSENASIYESVRYIVVKDFTDENFVNLVQLNRDELDARCKNNEVDVKKRGPGATNKSKREALRAKARNNRLIAVLCG
jgi:predicted ATP-dependent endonuclease of OLD family